MPYQWILFDADNTLLDFTGASQKAFAQASQLLEIPAQPDHFQRYKQANHIVWAALEKGQIDTVTLRKKRFELYLKDIQVDRDPVLFNKLYLDNLVRFSELLAGADSLLQHFHGRVKLGLITNGLKEVQRPRLDHTGITKYFDVIVVSDEIGLAKPDPAYFDHAFQLMNKPNKKDVLIVGDNLMSDIKGGVDYQTDTCWYNPSGKPNDTDIIPTLQINQLEELIDATTFDSLV